MDFLSLGASWQSTVLLLLAEADGIRPRPHAAVFADTRWEPHDVYEHLDWLETQTTIPIFRVGDRDLYQDTWDGVGSYGQTFTSIPVFALKSTGKMALSRRQCTHNYKIRPIQRRMRELVGRSPRSKYGPSVTQWLGISVDEAHRMKDSGVDWIKNRYPLVEMGMTRSDCRRWFAARYPGRPLVKSSCVGCPFHSDAEWLRLAQECPDDMAKTIRLDERLRSAGRPRNPNTKRLPEYLHQSGLPLDQVLTRLQRAAAEGSVLGQRSNGCSTATR